MYAKPRCRSLLPVTFFALLGANSLPAFAEDKAGSSEKKGVSEPDQSPPPGVDISKLDAFERKVFYRVLNSQPSACGKGHSLVFSLKHDPGCKRSVYAAKHVAKLVDAGFTDSEVGEDLQHRYRDSVQKKIDVSKAPSKGPTDAPVTIVEFVDYECPHCKTVQTLLRQVLGAYPNQVRLCFKQFPLGGHTNARLAAEATVAAQKQGKFWPYNDKVWDDSDNLTPALLEKIAKDVGLDVARWRTDMNAEETKARVAQDKADGVAMGINSTPTIYINGRKYMDRHDIESISDWVNEELGK